MASEAVSLDNQWLSNFESVTRSGLGVYLLIDFDSNFAVDYRTCEYCGLGENEYVCSLGKRRRVLFAIIWISGSAANDPKVAWAWPNDF